MGKVNCYTPLLVLLLLSSIVFPCLGIESAKGNPSASVSIQFSGLIVGSSMLKLHVEGTKIVDEFGREVELKGFNCYGRWVDWTRGADSWNIVPPPPGVTIGQQGDDMLWMKSHGFNLVRLLLFWEFLERTEGVYDETSFAYLDEIVNACEEYGIYVILDMHQWFWSSYFPGATGQTGQGFPQWIVSGYPATQTGCHDFALDFFTNRGEAAAARTKFINLWEYIANRYRDRKCVIYDLLAEAWNIPNRTDSEEVQGIQGYCDFFNNEVAPAIRGIDSSTIILYSAYDWVGPLKKQTVNNVAWGMSMYKKSYDSKGSPYDPAIDGSQIHDLLVTWQNKIERDFGAPLIFNEIGGDMSKPNNLMWLNDVLKYQEQIFGTRAHWSVWVYGKSAEWNEPWLPRYNWGNPPILDMPMVAVLDDHMS